MKKMQLGKRLQIEKSASRLVIVVALAAVLLVFAINSARILISEIGYTTRVLNAKDTAAAQLEENVKNSDKLIAEYKIFADSSTNVLGGSKSGSGPLDGSNDRIALDALPSKYDFPSMITSIEKILAARGVSIQSIEGQDEETANSGTQTSANPDPRSMPFKFEAKSNYQGIKQAIADMQRSIRPFNVTKMTITGSNDAMILTVEGETYYQPSKSLTLDKEEVK